MLKTKDKTPIIMLVIFILMLLITTIVVNFVSGLAMSCFVMLPVLLIAIIIKIINKQNIKLYLIAMIIFFIGFVMFMSASKVSTEPEITSVETTTELTTTTETTTETTTIIVTTTQITTITTNETTTETTTAAPVLYTDTSSQSSVESSGTDGYTADTYDSYADDTRYVYIGQTGDKYHRESCSTLKGNGIRITYDEAISQGRAACKRCKP